MGIRGKPWEWKEGWGWEEGEKRVEGKCGNEALGFNDERAVIAISLHCWPACDYANEGYANEGKRWYWRY